LTILDWQWSQEHQPWESLQT